VKFIDRKASRPREIQWGRGPGPNWMEEMKKTQGASDQGQWAWGGAGVATKFVERRQRLFLYIF